MKKVHVVFDPELRIDLAALATRWNRDPDANEMAEARVVHPEEQQESNVSYFEIPALSEGVLLLVGFMGGIALEATKEVIKERLKEYIRKLVPEPEPEFHVSWVPEDDGWLMIIRK